ncbi:hypothetical protein DNAOFDDG_01485 [Mannheimia haemolytica]
MKNIKLSAMSLTALFVLTACSHTHKNSDEHHQMVLQEQATLGINWMQQSKNTKLLPIKHSMQRKWHSTKPK